jgi:hypothetical protein
MEMFKNQPHFAPQAGPWPTQYSEEDVQQQRESGQQILQHFQQTLANGGTCFEFQPGVYRLAAPFVVDQVDGLEIVAADVELIIEGEKNAHFR